MSLGLRVSEVVASFGGQRVLHDVALELPAGDIGAVLGPSGSGKTTLLRVVAGLHRPDAGRVEVGGRAVNDGGLLVAPERRQVGLVPQAGALFPHLDVRQNIAFGLRRSSLGRAAPGARQRNARVQELLDLTDLGELAHRMPHQLSGGQQQRVALARALAPRPGLVLLDEPFASLDAALRSELREDVRLVLRGAGATALLVTHDQGEALSFADRLYVMRGGLVLQSGTPHGLYDAPVDTWVGRFLGDAVVVDGTSDGRQATCVLGQVSHTPAPAGAVQLLLRPEQLALSADPGHGLRGRVLGVRYFGHDALVDVEVAGRNGTAPFVVCSRVLSRDVAQVGAEVHVGVQGSVRAYPLG